MSQAVEGYSRAEAEKYIKDSSSAWAESVATNDPSVVKRILADDFVWVREGKVLDKSGAVTVAQQGPGDLVSNHLEYANVRFFGDTAVVQGSETWTRKGGRSGHFLFIDTWVRRDGIWQIVAAVDVSVPVSVTRSR
jgi:ketosteroid isomerase-like protein